MIYAVHQPDFLPWFGFFNKIHKADVFVVLDDVQLPNAGRSYMNRVQLLMGGIPRYFTAPVVKHRRDEPSRLRLVNESFFMGEDWKEKLKKTFQTHYARCSFFPEARELVDRLAAIPGNDLCRYNLAGIKVICEALQLSIDGFVRSSSLGVVSVRAQRIVDIGTAVRGTTYLSGTGARVYNDEDLFAAAGIQLIYQQVDHPRYRQPGVAEFQPGLSILDVIANCGLSETERLLKRAE